MEDFRKNTFNRFCLIAVVVSSIALFSVAANAGSISGTVTATNGGAAIEGFKVQAYNYVTKNYYSDHTSADGSYNITDIPSGNYRVSVQTFSTDYIQKYYSNTYFEKNATPVAIDVSSAVTINFSIEEGMKITGTLTEDAGGAPIGGVMLVAYDYETNEWMRWAHSDTSGNYQIQGLPAGSYRVRAWGNGYAVELYNNTYYPSQATPVDVNQGSDTTGINFNLAQGGTITGTIFESDGTAPITGTVIEVEILANNPCGNFEWLTNTGSNQANGTYEIRGVPPIDIHVRADENDAAYTTEWWASAGSSWDCSDAEALTISPGSTTPDINFQLDTGGNVSGIIEDANGSPLFNVKVSYDNYYCEKYSSVMTAPDGSFNFSNFPPGPTIIRVRPETQLGLVHNLRKYWLTQGQDMDVGTIRLKRGALVTGHLQDQDSVVMGNSGLYLSSDYTISWEDTLANGNYSFCIPKGYFAINMDNDEYYMIPKKVRVISVNQTIDMGISTAYNDTACSTVSGSISASAPHHGQFNLVAFPSGIDFSKSEWKGVNPISYTNLSDGPYTIYAPPGEDVVVFCCLESENNYGQMSLTVVNATTVISPPVSGINFSHTSEGVTVQGYIKSKIGYLFDANVSLIKTGTGDDEFFGFAETDQNGKFEFYNIQPGTYQFEAIYYDNRTGKSSAFTVGATPITIPDITVRSQQTISPLLYMLLLN